MFSTRDDRIKIENGSLQLHPITAPAAVVSVTITTAVEAQFPPSVTLSATFTEPVNRFDSGACQSQAALTCGIDEPNYGIMRVLPESMLPNSEPEYIYQCTDCYEASAEAYLRKLHARI
jgi:hypothetical protein